jgi:hypothetical protein
MIQHGSLTVLQALMRQYRNCPFGYRVASDSSLVLEIRLVTGPVVPGSEIDESLLNPYTTISSLSIGQLFGVELTKKNRQFSQSIGD